MVTLTKTFIRKYLKFYLVLRNLIIKEWGLILNHDLYSLAEAKVHPILFIVKFLLLNSKTNLKAEADLCCYTLLRKAPHHRKFDTTPR